MLPSLSQNISYWFLGLGTIFKSPLHFITVCFLSYFRNVVFSSWEMCSCSLYGYLHAAPLAAKTLVSVLAFLESNNYSRRLVALASTKGVTYTLKEYRSHNIFFMEDYNSTFPSWLLKRFLSLVFFWSSWDLAVSQARFLIKSNWWTDLTPLLICQ